MKEPSRHVGSDRYGKNHHGYFIRQLAYESKLFTYKITTWCTPVRIRNTIFEGGTMETLSFAIVRSFSHPPSTTTQHCMEELHINLLPTNDFINNQLNHKFKQNEKIN